MNLEFRLLVIDDSPDNIDAAIDILSDYLDSKGFTLNKHIPESFAIDDMRRLSQQEGRNYDLVMVDYDLGREDTNGADAIFHLRRDFMFTDMVFYSGISELELYGKLANQVVQGVFVATRIDLSDVLKGLADTVIGKVVDIYNLRGLAMAEVAEMDVMMEETLRKVLHIEDKCWDDVKSRTLQELREHIRTNEASLEKRVAEGGLPNIVGRGQLFTSAHKYHAVRRIAKCFPDQLSEKLQELSPYEPDIIHNRNLLAHSKHETRPDGTNVLQSLREDGTPVIIDEEWMDDFRRKLKNHRSTLTYVCESIAELSTSISSSHNP